MIQIILVIVYTFLFLFIIRKMKFFSLKNMQPKYVSLVFLVKVLAGCCLGLIYTYYYTDRSTADTFKFFDDGKILFGTLRENPKHFFEMLTGLNSDSPDLLVHYDKMNSWFNIDVLFNDNRTLIRLNAVFDCFSFGHYYVNVVFINFISFTGLIALFKLFQSFQKNKSKEIFAGVMLLPSMLFWGSGLLKDGLLLFALGMLLYSLSKIMVSRHSKINIAGFIFCLLLLTITKLYVLLIIFPGIVAWYWSRNEETKRKIIFKFTLSYTIYFILAFNIGSIADKYDVTDMIYYKQKNFYVIAEASKANSVIPISPVEASAWSIIKNSPEAAFRVLFRPTLTEAKSALILLAAVENIFILLIILLCLLSFKKSEIFRHPVFYFSIIFVVLMFTLIGLITPIMGAMVRYKVPALPFIMFIFISMYDYETLRSVFKKSTVHKR